MTENQSIKRVAAALQSVKNTGNSSDILAMLKLEKGGYVKRHKTTKVLPSGAMIKVFKKFVVTESGSNILSVSHLATA
jgi:hypothetical protein